jgi:hypothetical protein
MRSQKMVRTCVDLDNTTEAYDRIVRSAGEGNWHVVTLCPLEGQTRTMQANVGPAGELESAGNNPVSVLAVLEED